MVEQTNATELQGKIRVRTFLSYCQKISTHANVVKPLDACYKTHSIELVYDQSGIDKGESIIAFMHEELGTARCVV